MDKLPFSRRIVLQSAITEILRLHSSLTFLAHESMPSLISGCISIYGPYAAIGALVGSPISGAAKIEGGVNAGGTHDEIMRRWQGAWFVASCALLAATVLMAWARL